MGPGRRTGSLGLRAERQAAAVTESASAGSRHRTESADALEESADALEESASAGTQSAAGLGESNDEPKESASTGRVCAVQECTAEGTHILTLTTGERGTVRVCGPHHKEHSQPPRMPGVGTDENEESEHWNE